MSEALDIHGFALDRDEHQLEPDDRVFATYLVSNRCDCVELTDIVLFHTERVDNAGRTVLRCEPATVTLAEPLLPNEERQVRIELVTTGHLPGRHPFRVQAEYRCRPIQPRSDHLFDYSVVPD